MPVVDRTQRTHVRLAYPYALCSSLYNEIPKEGENLTLLRDRLAEFKYGGIPKETFAPILGSQDKPNMLYYYLKKVRLRPRRSGIVDGGELPNVRLTVVLLFVSLRTGLFPVGLLARLCQGESLQ